MRLISGRHSVLIADPVDYAVSNPAAAYRCGFPLEYGSRFTAIDAHRTPIRKDGPEADGLRPVRICADQAAFRV